MVRLFPMALGTMQFLWTTTERDAYEVLDAYYELGGNIIDTADMYSNFVKGLKGGEAETIIGKWMKSRGVRDEMFLISKVRARMWDGEDGEGLGKMHINKSIDGSLKRLQTDHLDMYLSHWPDDDTPIEDTLATYGQLIDSGKIRAVGCSNYSRAGLEAAMEAGNAMGVRYSLIESHYNLIDRVHFERDILPIATRYGMTMMCYGTLASGFLTDQYTEGQPLPSNMRSGFVKKMMTPRNLQIKGELSKLANDYNATISQLSLAWVLSRGYTPIVGADNVMQVKENMKAMKLHKQLSKQDMDAIERITS